MHKHRKHGKTVKTAFGNFGRKEIAIMGAPCGDIKALALQMIAQLKGFKIAYVDADHKTEESERSEHLTAGASLVYTDKIKFGRYDLAKPANKFERNGIFNEYDLVIVNGNHFEADMQIVMIDDRKPLEKKLEKITHPFAIVRSSDKQRLPEYLEQHLDKELEITPIYSRQAWHKVTNLVRDMLVLSVPSIKGLVLAGGKSERMGRDKGLIEYHGQPQRTYLAGLLQQFTEKVFISCRPDQVGGIDDGFKVIPDSVAGLGPFGALLSAFRYDPNAAWLVIACDIPLVDGRAILELIENRNPSKVATAFYNQETEFPDPLMTIWEPKAYQRLLHFLSLGYTCPRKVMINSDTEVVSPSNPDLLLNANSPEQYEKVMELLSGKTN